MWEAAREKYTWLGNSIDQRNRKTLEKKLKLHIYILYSWCCQYLRVADLGRQFSKSTQNSLVVKNKYLVETTVVNLLVSTYKDRDLSRSVLKISLSFPFDTNCILERSQCWSLKSYFKKMLSLPLSLFTQLPCEDVLLMQLCLFLQKWIS